MGKPTQSASAKTKARISFAVTAKLISTFVFATLFSYNSSSSFPPGKACSLLTDHLITGYPLRSEFAQEKWFQVHTYKPL